MVTVGENLFVGLRDACFGCGSPPNAPNCEQCRDVPPLDQPVHALIGARVLCARSPKPGIVVAVEGPSAEIFLQDGQPVKMAVASLSDQRRLDTARSMAEQLLAASHRWRPPAALDDALCIRAVSEAKRASSFVRLRFAEAARAVGRSELLDELNPPSETVAWLDALDLVRRERWQDAVNCLLSIPGAAFPARIGLWARTVDHLNSNYRRRIPDALRSFEGLGIAVDAAILTLRVAVERHNAIDDVDSALQELDGCLATAHRELYASLGQRLRTSNHLPEATLVRTLESSTSAIGEQAHLLQSAPATLIDDLIDDGTIDVTWLQRNLARRVREHITARTDPSQLSDEALGRFALVDEQARRAVLTGDSLPDDLPAATREQLAHLIELTQSPNPADAALAILTRNQDSAADALRDALDDPASVPSDDLLRSSIARFALGRTSVESLDVSTLKRTELSARQRTYVGTILLERAKRALLDWQYDEAVNEAKHCLRLTTDETIRDEALNLMACGDWQLGDDEGAISALETALKGEYTYPLQANFAVVAKTLDPERAAHHLTRLIDDAPDLRLKVAAAKQALGIWQTAELTAEQEDDLPPDFARSLRALVNAPIDEDDLRLFLRLLADHDATWLRDASALTASPHAYSEAARLYVARARSFENYVRELAKLLDQPHAPSWVVETRDGLLTSIIDALRDGDPALGALSIADLCFDSNMRMALQQRITLRGVMAASIARALYKQGDGEPALRFLDELEQAKADLVRLDDPGERATAGSAVDWGFRALAITYANNRWSQLEQAGELHDRIAYIVATTSMFQRNRTETKKAVRHIREVADDTSRLLTRLRKNVGEKSQELLDDAIDASSQLRTLAEQLQRKV